MTNKKNCFKPWEFGSCRYMSLAIGHKVFFCKYVTARGLSLCSSIDLPSMSAFFHVHLTQYRILCNRRPTLFCKKMLFPSLIFIVILNQEFIKEPLIFLGQETEKYYWYMFHTSVIYYFLTLFCKKFSMNQRHALKWLNFYINVKFIKYD